METMKKLKLYKSILERIILIIKEFLTRLTVSLLLLVKLLVSQKMRLLSIPKIVDSDIILLLGEIPDEVNLSAAKFAKAYNKTVIFDMGSRDNLLSEDLLKVIDIISLNES